MTHFAKYVYMYLYIYIYISQIQCQLTFSVLVFSQELINNLICYQSSQ